MQFGNKRKGSPTLKKNITFESVVVGGENGCRKSIKRSLLKAQNNQMNDIRITQNKVCWQWLPSSVVCCQMTSHFKNKKCLNKRGRIDNC